MWWNVNLGIMVLVDKRILGGGIALIVAGVVLTTAISASMPVGQTGMTEDEAIDLLIAQQEMRTTTRFQACSSAWGSCWC